MLKPTSFRQASLPPILILEAARMASNAERQRRYRAHKAGDHSLCDPARGCEASGDGVTSPVTTPVTAPRLGLRGRRLWQDVTADARPLSPSERVLLEEACRLADRLDRLDALLRGDATAWLRFQPVDDGPVVAVVVDKALSEARQQQATLKQLLAELRQTQGRPQQLPKQEASRRDELAKRREERRRAAGL